MYETKVLEKMNEVKSQIFVQKNPGHLTLIGGPCSIESPEQFTRIARPVLLSGAQWLRGGIFKMRTKPGTFQGLGLNQLDELLQAKMDLGAPVVSEVVDPRHIEEMLEFVDMFQVGSRNMYNYELLKELGKTRKPVLLKRGFSATIDEWLSAADYVVNGGNSEVILCERGIRTFETKTRNTLDLNAVAYLKAHHPFPVFVDPSHGTGVRELVKPMALAGVAAGADGLIVEVHDRPAEALSDGFQALTPAQFDVLAQEAQALKKLMSSFSSHSPGQPNLKAVVSNEG